VDQELVAYLDRRFSELKSEITGELRAEIGASAAAVMLDLRARSPRVPPRRGDSSTWLLIG